MDGSDIPPFFICPISLQIMNDPVTLSTGITYDRESIGRWLFTYNRDICPVTKQPLTDRSLTPNTTLLRLIQSWWVHNLSKFSSTTATPNPTFDVIILGNLVDEVRSPKSDLSQIKSLRKIRSLIEENEDNRRYMEEDGMASLMASLINDADPTQGICHLSESSLTLEEAMHVFYVLKPTRETLKRIGEHRNGKIIESLSILLMQRGSYQARIHASLLLKSIFKVVDDNYRTGLKSELFDGIVEILKDQDSNRATKAALSILVEVAPVGRMNAMRAVEAGVVAVVVELLAEINEGRSCELMLRVLEILCGRADGRAAFMAHPASVAAVSSKILRTSPAANDRAVKVLLEVCRFCGSSGVVAEMVEVGGVAKLCMVMQAQCSRKTQEMAKEMLGLHLKVWKKSPCFPSYLLP